MINAAADRVVNYKPAIDVKIHVDNLKIMVEDVYSRMSNKSKSLDAHFHKTINDICLHLSEKCHICAGYVIYPVQLDQIRKRNFKIGDAYFNVGEIVISQLKKTEQAAVFACTIGSKMENWSRQVIEAGEPAQSYLIDIAASAITEKAVDYLHDYIGVEMAKQNLNITNRFSPGYCDWPVSDQHILFSLLPENFCGISLNESALMHPIKSVSGIIGVGPDVKYRDYMCDGCQVKDCTYRIKHFKNANLINKGSML